jgi:maltose alpha-D-glucosyltransferase/alpha-amylase
VLPPIMDPIYGYEAINVEAQAANQHSLLNWTRRMLAVRKQFRAFGRGTLRFLYPGNRKVLAYLRELPATNPDEQSETVLCVFNLSRAAQAVEVDLSGFAGLVPVDTIGGSTFPPVGQLYYLLTLPPYGFFWFLLAPQTQLPSWYKPTPEPLPEFATLVVRHDVEEVLAPGSRAILEGEALPAYLPKRRWFAAKGEPLRGVRIAYARRLPNSNPPVLLAEVEALLPDRTETYLLPLGFARDDENAPALAQQLALARIRRGGRVGFLTDAFAVDGLARGVMAALRNAAELPLPQGVVEFRPTSKIAELSLPDDAEIRRLSAEQSNSSLIIGDAVVLKLIRRVSAGIHPEGEMTRYLTERGFGNIAPLYGEMVRVAPDGTPHTLALAQGFVRNQGDGWEWTLDFLARTVEELAVIGETDETETDAFTSYNAFASATGRRLAELHSVLAAPADDPDFAPEVADKGVLTSWAEAVIEQMDSAFALLRAAKEWPDPQTGELADALLGLEEELRQLAHKLAQSGVDALRTRVHGDFHLGQVLVVQGDAYIIDFEGEPARPMAQRRMKSCPLRDVAGLLRSFDYAAATAAPGRVAASPQAAERRMLLLERFREQASACFLQAYREVLGTSERRWVPPSAEQPLLELFLIEKAAYEIRYEAANRPTWLGIPVRGLHAIAARLLAPAESEMA